MEKLQITQENYKGYAELYLAKTSLTETQKDEIVKKTMISLGVGFFASFPIVLATQFFYSVLLCAILSTLSTFPLQYQVVKKEIKKVKRKYPMLDCNVSISSLYNGLKEAGIITQTASVEEVNAYEYERGRKLDLLMGRNKEINRDSLTTSSDLEQEKEQVKVKRFTRNGRI